ncbi:predicted protein [Lichtheimia corymbifera JMRC:FSU:9682]|uniref:Uncharacterized protein n=1 Tax=Lichtheimia corymbifera JMRC:FSU:9682 TaxID=1263082 RepID=A0A068RSZ3_9FUNG|nr:predicted protein [Lichtheimia corymbifera JMRC:FSU:9682]
MSLDSADHDYDDYDIDSNDDYDDHSVHNNDDHHIHNNDDHHIHNNDHNDPILFYLRAFDIEGDEEDEFEDCLPGVSTSTITKTNDDGRRRR